MVLAIVAVVGSVAGHVWQHQKSFIVSLIAQRVAHSPPHRPIHADKGEHMMQSTLVCPTPPPVRGDRTRGKREVPANPCLTRWAVCLYYILYLSLKPTLLCSQNMGSRQACFRASPCSAVAWLAAWASTTLCVVPCSAFQQRDGFGLFRCAGAVERRLAVAQFCLGIGSVAQQ